jgi:predicted Zn-dependent protease
VPSRLEAFREMVAKNPSNVLARFGLANEAVKEKRFEEAAENYAAYLDAHDDEGNGWQRYAEVLLELGRPADAKAALRSGIEAARRFGHPSMASELEERLADVS